MEKHIDVAAPSTPNSDEGIATSYSGVEELSSMIDPSIASFLSQVDDASDAKLSRKIIYEPDNNNIPRSSNHEQPTTRLSDTTYRAIIANATRDVTLRNDDQMNEQEVVKQVAKRRYCRIEGCVKIVKSQGLCQRHGAKPKNCRIENCTKQAQGNFDGMCKAHYKSINLRSPTCVSSGIGTETPIDSNLHSQDLSDPLHASSDSKREYSYHGNQFFPSSYHIHEYCNNPYDQRQPQPQYCYLMNCNNRNVPLRQYIQPGNVMPSPTPYVLLSIPSTANNTIIAQRPPPLTMRNISGTPPPPPPQCTTIGKIIPPPPPTT